MNIREKIKLIKYNRLSPTDKILHYILEERIKYKKELYGHQGKNSTNKI